MICAATETLWGFRPGLQFSFNASRHYRALKLHRPVQVEKDGACVKYAMRAYPEACLFTDILDMVNVQKGFKDTEWRPSKLKLKKKAYCKTHGQEPLCYYCVKNTLTSF